MRTPVKNRSEVAQWLGGAVAAVLMAMACLPVLAGELHRLEHQGIERRFAVHNGAAATGAPVPVVVHLHGYRSKKTVVAAGDDLSWAEWPALNRVAEGDGFAIVYPTARFGKWSLTDGMKNAATDDGRPLDDVGFILGVVRAVVDAGLADPARVYLTGFSDGAIMTYRMLCQPQTPFAAAAAGAGTMMQVHHDACAADHPAPILAIAGTNDRILPYDGWIFRTGREVSIPEVMELFRRRHGCIGQETSLREDRDPDDDSRVREVRWTGCTPDGAVMLLRAEGGGHTWPSHEAVAPEWREKGGGHNRDIESAEEVWQFLRQFNWR